MICIRSHPGKIWCNGINIIRGRVLIYIKSNDPNFDMNNGRIIEAIPFKVLQYFLIPGLYPRTEIFFYQSEFTIEPDYFRRYSFEKRYFLTISEISEWVTNVTVYNPGKAF
jgi:hypothetical protein